MIEACSFGKMTVDGRAIASDLMILPSGDIIDSWRRIRGHHLVLADIQRLLDAQPDIIVAGTGIYGRMRIDPKLEAYCSRNGIKLIAQQTKAAAQTYNDLKNRALPVAGCFHLTC